MPYATRMRQSECMTDYSDAATASIRLSNADRDEAVARLARAHGDGRLTADEYTERSDTAKTAKTRGELAPLFADLPDTTQESVIGSTAGSAPDPDFGPPPAAAYPSKPGDESRDSYNRTRPLGGTAGVVAVSVTPLIALAAFLLCGFLAPDGFAWSWLFWLAVPIVGIIVYGPAGRSGNRD
jgi:hypothetical protein